MPLHVDWVVAKLFPEAKLITMYSFLTKTRMAKTARRYGRAFGIERSETVYEASEGQHSSVVK